MSDGKGKKAVMRRLKNEKCEKPIVWPQPISAEALLSYNPGKHELWTIPAGHTFDSDERDTAVNQVIEKTVSFIVEHN